MQKRDNLIPQTFLPLHESGRARERGATGSFSTRRCRTKRSALLFIPSLPIPAAVASRPSVFCLGRRGQSIFHVDCLTSTKRTTEQSPMEGRDESEEGEEGRGAHHCIIRLNRLEKNKYKVCQASFLPTPHRARRSVSPTTGRQAGRASGPSVSPSAP